MISRFKSAFSPSRVLPFRTNRSRTRTPNRCWKGFRLRTAFRRAALAVAFALLAFFGWRFVKTDPAIIFATGSQKVRAIDGDTIWLLAKSPIEKIRIVGLDAPETFRAKCDEERRRGLEAKARLIELLDGENWSIDRLGRVDKYGRTLARVLVGRRDVAHVMISENLARQYIGGGRKGWCR